MTDARLEQLFERFARHGDVAALGAVFDETAGELLRVGMALVREPAEADDLLQETFLTAIERAGRYDAQRRLVPWLLGILAHHAREQRRVARRGLDSTRLERAAPQRPEEALLRAEVDREVEHAFSELSTRERVVLEAYLKHGKGAAEISQELGSSPGAVRMQIHRGLERLRKALPAGLAIGAASSALSAQGLDGVRAAVLRAGEQAASSLAGGGAVGGLGSKLETAGVLMGKKTVALAVVVALCALLLTWVGLERRRELALDGGAGDGTAAARAENTSTVGRAPELDAQTSARRSEVSGSSAPVKLEALVGGLRGRLVERSGAPVAGKSVALLEIEEQALLEGLQASAPSAPPQIFVASAISGADGVFVLDGARPFGAMQALGIDLGGSRPSVRVLDVAFAAGEYVDIGDVVLAPTAVLRGRVVDEHGAPIAGARVRAGQLTDFLLRFGIHELAPGAAVGELRSSGRGADEEHLENDGLEVRYLFEVPDWLAQLEPRLPFVTVLTNERGEFQIAEAPAAQVSLLLDRPGRTAVAATTLKLEEGVSLDVGALTLDAGRTLAGRVLDATGKPVAGVQVRGGRAAGARAPAMFGPVRTTDAQGRFHLTGLSTLDGAVVIARRDSASTWTALLAEGEAIELHLAPEFELIVTLVDSARAPIADPVFEFAPGREAANVGILAAARRPVTARSLGEGRWSLGLRASGPYLLCAQAKGFARKTAPCELPAAGPITLVLEPSVATQVRVVAAEDGAPLAGALVTAESISDRGGRIASASTDSQGLALLELPGQPTKALWIRAEHAHFATRGAPLEDPRAPLTLALTQGGSVTARSDPRQFGERRHMLVLDYRGATPHLERAFPRLAAFDTEGVARRSRLPAGQWSWSVVESLATGEALAFLGEQEAPRTLARGEFELADGQTLEFAIGATAATASDGGEATGLVLGAVRVNGALAEGVSLYLTAMTAGAESGQRKVESKDGMFRFEAVEAGSYFLTAARESDAVLSQLGSQKFELAAGEVREFALEYATLELEVEVTTETGKPAPQTGVALAPVERGSLCNGQTDGKGRARLVLTVEGRYTLTASHPKFGVSISEIDVVRGGETRLAVRLGPGVPCEGVARLAAGIPRPKGRVTLALRREGGNVHFAQAELKFERSEAAFAFVGAPPGRYLVSAYLDDEWQPEIPLIVPDGGSTTLELVLGLPPPAAPVR